MKKITQATKYIQVQLVHGKIYSYRDRYAAVGTNNKATIAVTWKKTGENKIVLLQDTIPYPIHYAADDDEDDELDWEIEVFGGDKHLLLTLYKASPMEGVTLFWKRPLEQVKEEIDNPNPNSSNLQSVWNEAHAMFREKLKRGEIPSRLPK